MPRMSSASSIVSRCVSDQNILFGRAERGDTGVLAAGHAGRQRPQPVEPHDLDVGSTACVRRWRIERVVDLAVRTGACR